MGNQLRLPPQARTEKGSLYPEPQGSRGKGRKGSPKLAEPALNPDLALHDNWSGQTYHQRMSTVAEIQQAINQLNEQERSILLTQLFATAPQPDENNPELLAALDRGIADDESDNVVSADEVRRMIPQWISKSRSPETS